MGIPMITKLLKKETVAREVVGCHPQTLMRWVRAGTFPKPIVPAPGSTSLRWREAEVAAWIAARAAAYQVSAEGE